MLQRSFECGDDSQFLCSCVLEAKKKERRESIKCKDTKAPEYFLLVVVDWHWGERQEETQKNLQETAKPI